jgi:glyoxylase-like metal-dependent hydrolase (beta-lactamase superfamily II)/rhodanese-related sulfurtransferase
VAAVVDPQRDVRPYLEAAQSHGLQITHIIETHLHADHVSGNTELAARTNADIYIHEAAEAEFPHKPLKDGDVLELGAVRIAVRHTPGHTPESITLLVSDTKRAQEPWMALTGDLLFVGDIGRPDLVGAEAVRGLAADLYNSLFENILKLDDSLIIYPGHGAGSLCGRSIGSVRSSTLGYERKYNPALEQRSREVFVEYMTTNLPEQPGNHRRIKAINRRGSRPLGEVTPQPLSIPEAIPHFRRGAGLLDLRSKAAYVDRHVPGSVHLEAGDQFSNRVGFVLSAEQPVILLLENEADYADVVYSLARVGYDQVLGYLAGGLDAWEAAGLAVTSGDIQDVSAIELKSLIASGNGDRPVVIDVREPWEYAQGHIPGAKLIPLGQLVGSLAELEPSHPVAVVCASGSRSQSAAALLGQKGFAKVYNLQDGMHGWQMAGLEIER